MWKLFKRLFFLAVIVIAVLAITGYKIAGKTVQEHFKSFMQTHNLGEGVKDLKSLAGEIMKTIGQTAEVSDEERKELDDVIKKEIQDTSSKKKDEPSKRQETAK